MPACRQWPRALRLPHEQDNLLACCGHPAQTPAAAATPEGKFAPGHKGGQEGIYSCARHVLLAHARAKRLSRTRYASLKHKIGIALNVEWAEPMYNTSESARPSDSPPALQRGCAPACSPCRAPSASKLRPYARARAQQTRACTNTSLSAALHPPPPPGPLPGEHRAAAQRNLDIQFGVFADPLFFGK